VKKVLLLVAAFLIIFSSVAAVSAYEAHKVDIKVHVENAIALLTDNEINLDTMFPQEVVETDIAWGMSRSFYAQDRLSEIGYRVYFELKNADEFGDLYDPTGEGPQPRYMDDYFQPLNPFMTITSASFTVADPEVYQAKPTDEDPVEIGRGVLNWTNTGIDENLCASMHLHIDIPVFEGYYNAVTDAGVRPGTWGTADWTPTLMEGDYVLVPESICGVCVDVPHADLGVNVKIQVSGYGQHSGVRTHYDYPAELDGACDVVD